MRRRQKDAQTSTGKHEAAKQNGMHALAAACLPAHTACLLLVFVGMRHASTGEDCKTRFLADAHPAYRVTLCVSQGMTCHSDSASDYEESEREGERQGGRQESER